MRLMQAEGEDGAQDPTAVHGQEGQEVEEHQPEVDVDEKVDHSVGRRRQLGLAARCCDHAVRGCRSVDRGSWSLLTRPACWSIDPFRLVSPSLVPPPK